MPFCEASSTTYWMAGLSLGPAFPWAQALAKGRNLVPETGGRDDSFLDRGGMGARSKFF